jgi:hypothetical protein
MPEGSRDCAICSALGLTSNDAVPGSSWLEWAHVALSSTSPGNAIGQPGELRGGRQAELGRNRLDVQMLRMLPGEPCQLIAHGTRSLGNPADP